MANESHILFVSKSTPLHQLGGMELISWDLAREFAKEGKKVTFLTTAIQNKPAEFMMDGIHVIAIEGVKPARYSKKWWRKSTHYFESYLSKHVTTLFSVSAAGYAIVKSKHFPKNITSILQTHGACTAEIKSNLKTLSWKTIPLVLNYLYRLLIDLYHYPKFDHIVAVGKPTYTELKKFPYPLVLDNKKVALINNGINNQLFYPNPIQKEKIRNDLELKDNFVIITASRLHFKKGIDQALRAFAHFLNTHPESYFLIIGEGPERSNLEKLSSQLKISEKVKFLGFISRTDIPSYLAAADAFLFTTRLPEGLPLNILEALATGIPAIYSKHLEKIFDFKTGLFSIDPSDPVAVASIMEYIFKIKTEKKYSFLPEFYTLNYCVNQYIKMIEQKD